MPHEQLSFALKHFPIRSASKMEIFAFKGIYLKERNLK